MSRDADEKRRGDLANYEQLRECLADYAHVAWSDWMHYLFSESKENEDGSVTIPVALVQRWRRQSVTPYLALPRAEAESDRVEADRMLEIIDGVESGTYCIDASCERCQNDDPCH